MTNTMTWYCPKCGHVVISEMKPEPIRWSDGHVCYFKPESEEGEAFKVSDQKAKEEKVKEEKKTTKFHTDCAFYDSKNKSWNISKAQQLKHWKACMKCEHKNSCIVFEHVNNFKAQEERN